MPSIRCSFHEEFTLAGKPTRPTYHVTEVSVIAQVDTVKPKLVRHELEAKTPRAFVSYGPVLGVMRSPRTASHDMHAASAGGDRSLRDGSSRA